MTLLEVVDPARTCFEFVCRVGIQLPSESESGVLDKVIWDKLPLLVPSLHVLDKVPLESGKLAGTKDSVRVVFAISVGLLNIEPAAFIPEDFANGAALDIELGTNIFLARVRVLLVELAYPLAVDVTETVLRMLGLGADRTWSDEARCGCR
jgi:hypothetical protein